ncbi:hypothetical protein, partial [Vibrio parahaemolyticus]|uniref:hypothetical protein n=1 Tax=Vibrio parahaemolyticus TaxID=670 RepID=UPI001D16BF16
FQSILGVSMKIGSKVRLKTFNGTLECPDVCKLEENYWLLIGEVGTVVGERAHTGRLIIQFANDIQRLGLYCHNPEPNALYILRTDLVLDA